MLHKVEVQVIVAELVILVLLVLPAEQASADLHYQINLTVIQVEQVV
jgi:hypothetical protein